MSRQPNPVATQQSPSSSSQTPLENQPAKKPTSPPTPTKLYAVIGVLALGLLASLATTAYLLLNQPEQPSQTTQTPEQNTQMEDSQEQTSQESGLSENSVQDNFIEVSLSSTESFTLLLPDSLIECDNSELLVDLRRKPVTCQTEEETPFLVASTNEPEKRFSNFLRTEESQKMISGQNALETTHIYANGEIRVLTFPTLDSPLFIQLNYDDLEALTIYDQILSTFEFVESEESDRQLKFCSSQILNISVSVPEDSKCETFVAQVDKSNHLQITTDLLSIHFGDSETGPHCIPRCTEEDFYSNPETGTLTKHIYEGKVLGFWGETENGPWVNVSPKDLSKRDLNDQEKAQIFQVLDSL